jgi:acetyltransferase-like isoleucine patch superfamily enzyme
MAEMVPRRLWLLNGFVFKCIPPSRGHRLKASLLRWAGANIGFDCEIMSSAQIIGDLSLTIGNGCFIGHQAMVFGPRGSSVTIGDFAKVGSRTTLVTGSHRFSPDGLCIEKEGTSADIRVGEGAAVSTGSIVLPGVTIGRMAHVAPGSVVTKDVPEFCRVAGVPARVVKNFRESS